MSHHRVAFCVIASVGAFVIAPLALPANATVSHQASAVSSHRAGHALIQGVVTDQFGKPVDDVEVQATKADGTPAASAITYASDRKNGAQHGYFFLEVTRGTYTLSLTRNGYRTVELERQITKAGQHASLGEVEIEKKLIATATDASLVKKIVTTKQDGEVHITVTPKSAGPTGDVEVREGRAVVGQGHLRSGDKGDISIDLDQLRKGKHELKAYYLGSTKQKGSSSTSFTLTVIKAKH